MIIKAKRLWWIMATLIGLVIFGVGCGVFAPAYEFKGAILEPPTPLPDFELKDTNEQPFHLSDVNGEIALVYFGYTFCPDVCPLTMWDVKKALAGLESRDKVKVIFISVDPERDTPQALGQYLSGFDSNYIGLTDEMENIEQVMKPFGAFAEKEEVANSAAQYLVSHTARLYLINPEQELLLMYPFGFEPDDLRSDLSHLLDQLGS
jgi:protein SCO1/2